MIAIDDTTLLSNASALIAEVAGLHFPEGRWADLRRGLKAAADELDLESPEVCVSRLAAGELRPAEIDILAGYLTVGETYFLRDPTSFAALEEDILPRLVTRRSAQNRTLRLWSAGCCTGEEAYSLAITCARALPNLPSWNVSVLGTDINPKFLAKGEAGVYSQWSFRGVPDWLRRRYFSPAPGGRYSIDPSIRKLVQFGQLNLAEDVYPALHNYTNAMDVIFCRNVIMYFTPDHQRRVVAALHRCLVDDGYLVVSAAEATASLFPMFAMENIGGAIVCRKASGARPAVARSAAAPASPSAATTPPTAPSRPGVIPEPVAPLPEAVLAEESAADRVAPPGPTAWPDPTAPDVARSRESALASARALAGRGSLDEALSSCEEAIAADRTAPAAYFLHAEICHELGRSDEELVALRRVLYLDPDFILGQYALGDLYRRLGRQKESRRHLGVALELLSGGSRDELVPESDGMTRGRLAELVGVMMGA